MTPRPSAPTAGLLARGGGGWKLPLFDVDSLASSMTLLSTVKPAAAAPKPGWLSGEAMKMMT